MLEVSRLSVFYGQHRALSDVAINVVRGEIVVILGANGAGKSTLLQAIAGFVPAPAPGAVILDGRALAGVAPHQVVEAGIAFVPERRGIFAALTVRENLLLGANPARARPAESVNLGRVLALFPRLRERFGQTVRTMSGGEQQMVAIGRALMSAPNLLLLDEPSLGLAPRLCKDLFRTLSRIRESGVGILLVEQNARQSLAIADRGYLLAAGRIVGEGRAAALRADSRVQRAYLGASSDPRDAVNP